MKNLSLKFRQLPILAAINLMGPKAFADFKVPTTAYSSAQESAQACTQLTDSTGMNEKKATAELIWTALCRSDIVEHYLTNEGLFVFNNHVATSTFDHKVWSNQDVVAVYFRSFGSEIEVENGVPAGTIPLAITSIPLLTYDDPALIGFMKAWTGFPKNMPIQELLDDPKSYKLFCSSAELPKYSFKIDSGFIKCDLGELGSDLDVRLPSIPPFQGGQYKTSEAFFKNLGCHAMRIEAARSGQISHQQLFDYSAKNLVPKHRDPFDSTSEVVGAQPCANSLQLTAAVPVLQKSDVSLRALGETPFRIKSPVADPKEIERFDQSPDFSIHPDLGLGPVPVPKIPFDPRPSEFRSATPIRFPELPASIITPMAEK